jgi:hypothetical protein
MPRDHRVDRRSLLRAAGVATGATVTGSLFGTGAASADDRMTADRFEAGAARVEASPLPEHLDEGVYLGGFGVGPVREAEGVHDGCFARALSVTAGTEPVALAMLDLIGLGNVQLEAIRRRAADRTGLDEQRILVGASHSHSGPDFQGLWGGVPPSYREYVVEKTVDAVAAAVESREPATAHVGSVDAPEHSSNRRGWGFTTETLTALQFRRGDGDGNGDDGPPENPPIINPASGPPTDSTTGGDVLATLVSYAAHPTEIGSDNQLVATDYVGPLERSLEASEGGVAVFYPGAIGDASSSGSSGETDFEEAADYGETLADVAREALADAESVKPGMAVRTGSVRLPLDNCVFRTAYAAGFLRPYYTGETPSGTAASTVASAVGGVSPEAERAVREVAGTAPDAVPLAIYSPIARVSLGREPDRLELLTIPGEAVTRLGLQLEAIADSDHRFLLGLTQNSLGYFVREDEYGELEDRTYEETVSLGPDTAPIYRNGVRGLFDLPREPFERSPPRDRTCPETMLQLESQLQDLQNGEMSASVCCAGDADHDHAVGRADD